MSDPRLALAAPTVAPRRSVQRPLLGHLLVEDGHLAPEGLARALEAQLRMNVPLGEILVAEGLLDEDTVLRALARQQEVHLADLEAEAPDEGLARLVPASVWLRHSAIAWHRVGPAIVVACARPDQIDALRADLPRDFPPILPVLASQGQIQQALARIFREELGLRAEARVASVYSCRSWRPTRPLALLAALALTALAALVWPHHVMAVLCMLAVLSLVSITTLKLAGLLGQGWARLRPAPPPLPAHVRLPRISVLVPLYKETEIAGALLTRLKRLSYPKALLDVVLVLEEKDDQTRAAIAGTDLPLWMRVIEVPDIGCLTTKPRALNFALDFCRGDIIGIWDAEDAPAPDQLEVIARHFAAAPPDVVCLQGILDYYNPRANWLSRCFTIEYASWFRVVLPGIGRLGLVLPLGGTTLFVRRDALEAMGGWDAHNVTEDADLGLRIARFGWRTQTVPTMTAEEANCRPWPWVRQRSRWLKGFMVTWAVHMRHPRRLLADLGWKRFLGVQAFFLGTLGQFLLAPVLWSFWLVLAGLPHPADPILEGRVVATLFVLFLASEAVNAVIALAAVSGPRHRFLIPWIVTMPLYYPLGALAGYKALWELFLRPFWWDKTQHGKSPADAG